MDDARDLRRLADRADIVDVILRAADAMDRQDWAALAACLAPVIDVDYSDLRGDPPATVSADEYVTARRAGLAGLRTQHVSTNHLVTIDGDRASCRSCFVIHRVAPALPDGERFFDTAGHYAHALRRGPDGWRITAITQTVVWNRGNPDVHGALRGRSGGGRG